MLSVVVPAHNEEAVIGRGLASLLDGLPEGSEVLVVCNGCTDRTAAVASSFGPPVKVLETPVASKSAALNLGDRCASVFPRAFVDADVEVTGADLARVADALRGPNAPLAAAPALRTDLTGLSPAARAYYRVWTQLPWITDDLIGSGVYVLSRDGRSRFDQFPPIIADDLFVHRLFSGGERRSIAGAEFTVRPPRDTRDLVHVQVRRRAGNREYARHFQGAREATHGTRRMLLTMARNPRNWPGLAVYGEVTSEARLRGWWKVRFGDLSSWERETGSRQTTVSEEVA